MKTQIFETREEWEQARRGKITGSRLGDMTLKQSKAKKIGFYELIAERLGIPADDEDSMQRGTRLEPEAILMFEQETGHTVDRRRKLWMRDDNESIAISPDGDFNDEEDAVEAKCLASSRHIEAYLTQKIPKDYEYQRTQYFVVNDKLKRLHFAFYDPRLIAKPFFIITVHRHEIEKEIMEAIALERDILTEVTSIVNQLSNF
jgi:predicted phage-related endonuclease